MAGEGGGEGRGEGRSSALGIPEEPRVALTDGKCRGKQDVGLSTPVLHVASVSPEFYVHAQQAAASNAQAVLKTHFERLLNGSPARHV